MDETPEQLEEIRREAAAIDVYRYRRRRRAMAAVALGMLAAGVVWVVMEAVDKARNPCDRAMRYFCGKDPKSLDCISYQELKKDSEDKSTGQMSGNIRHQCQVRIERLKIDEGVTVP